MEAVPPLSLLQEHVHLLFRTRHGRTLPTNHVTGEAGLADIRTNDVHARLDFGDSEADGQ